MRTNESRGRYDRSRLRYPVDLMLQTTGPMDFYDRGPHCRSGMWRLLREIVETRVRTATVQCNLHAASRRWPIRCGMGPLRRF